ncbi:hypothetical protein SHKM778_58740 [Streptomyces sp. KM77-8]|uniref:Uncharacterized protein n=1 Tax=Streptomyces haneummycinicus TaxID=3074435 RepID=A0AAT9HPT4_9ACTN
MPAEPFGQPARRVRVPAHHGGEPAGGASSPVAGSCRSPAGAPAARDPPVSVARSSDSTRAARLAEGREKEYAIAISSTCLSGYVSTMTEL